MNNYLEGFIPYKKEVMEEFRGNGAWEDLTYGDILDRTTDQYPENIAVIDDRNRLTYKTLKEKVDRFAIALIKLGVKPHDRLILQLPNRYEFVVAFYGMQKMGAVPLLSIPRHEYRELSTFFKITEAVGWIVPLRDGKIEFLPLIEKIMAEFKGLKHIIMPRDSEALPPFAVSLENLIEEVNIDDYSEDYLAQFRPDPNDVAVLIPTGGTTGLPKMVPRTHNNLIVTNRIISQRLDATDKTLQATPVGHAMAMQGAVNCAVFRGATLVLQAIPRPKEMMETIQREKITGAFMVPTQLEGIMNHPELDRYDLSSLKNVGTTGAALPREVAEKAWEYCKSINCKFSGNGLGASEGLLAGGGPDDPLDVQLSTVGRSSTPGSHYKVIDGQENELPLNTEGELVARGPEVFTGYYKTTEEENREVFTRDGYYRTGDLARINEQGYITITGRKKDVIMRGGETLVPSEMEDLIRTHPSVESVAVIGMPDPKMGERACAYVALRQGKTIAFDEMVEYLKSQGASVLLLPERLEIIEGLPLTPVGKVDKKALRKDIEQKLKK
jgi:non-ribosomal peptide synthetase component E (peptide arylation enzyme)